MQLVGDTLIKKPTLARSLIPSFDHVTKDFWAASKALFARSPLHADISPILDFSKKMKFHKVLSACKTILGDIQ